MMGHNVMITKFLAFYLYYTKSQQNINLMLKNRFNNLNAEQTVTHIVRLNVGYGRELWWIICGQILHNFILNFPISSVVCTCMQYNDTTVIVKVNNNLSSNLSWKFLLSMEPFSSWKNRISTRPSAQLIRHMERPYHANRFISSSQ